MQSRKRKWTMHSFDQAVDRFEWFRLNLDASVIYARNLIGVKQFAKMKNKTIENFHFHFSIRPENPETHANRKRVMWCGRQMQTHKHWKQHTNHLHSEFREYVWSATSIHYKYNTFTKALEWNKCRLFIIRLRWQLNSNQYKRDIIGNASVKTHTHNIFSTTK